MTDRTACVEKRLSKPSPAWEPKGSAQQAHGPRRPAAQGRAAWWISWLNRGVGALIAGQLIGLAWLLTRPALLPAAPVLAEPPGEQPDILPPRVEVASLVSAASRAMFRVEGIPPHLAASAAPPLSEQARTWASRLGVIGVVTGHPAQAVIEDAQTRKTYLVGVGQTFLEGLVVQAIEPGRVRLMWQGESIELVL